ncbi:hypothetical protein NLG97_g8050 [Lecanicillium saksenae]|uniref:Uncharacterized protein n=1 Tax=Lecanicillium saksenae TaxID=468837 RepID=A0ACC1QNB0_9HYPO|nr:hypothetical protein NLG97_g8050 [Lecanicillium saksenae]
MAKIDFKTRPIAIIGMSCRLPGAVDTPEKLWEVVSAARNTWSRHPSHHSYGRNEDAFYHPRAETLGTNHSQGGHFLNQDVAACDISFFNFTPDVAKSMDPQVRVLLEMVFEALESAGITLEMAASSLTSVFAGAMSHDYQDILMQDMDNLPRYYLTGNAPAMVANRISHFFDLRGPSVSVDTACSTAMAALHLACQSLRLGDSSMAVVGGSNLILSPSSSIGLSTLGLTGSTGKSFGFDERASGYGRGEGVGCLLLKPLDDALRDGDPIRAVIRETAMNQDGNTPTITSPSVQAQEAIMKQCYAAAGLDPQLTGYVECHGTGTLVGDKVETASVAKVFAVKSSMHGPLHIGSVKANFGHTESTSGVAAVIKVVKMLEANRIPPQALFSSPNPNIDFEKLNIKVAISWPEGKRRRVSINNFGAGGTNTHAIIESADYYSHKNQDSGRGMGSSTSASLLFPLSSARKDGLQSVAARLVEYLGGIELSPQTECEILHNMAYTLSMRRSHFSWRSAFVAGSVSQLVETLARPPEVQSQANLSAPRLAFVFTGQGAQWPEMGCALIGVYPVFRKAIDDAQACLSLLGAEWDIVQELTKPEATSRLAQPYLSFPCTVIIQLALVRLLASWNITPSRVTGHSSGEISAAYAAGILAFEEAITVAYLRGRLTSEAVDSGRIDGGMAALGASENEAFQALEDLGLISDLVIACVNSASNVTLAGATQSLDVVSEWAKSKSIFYRRLDIPAAYHSPQMECLSGEYLTRLESHFSDHNTCNSGETGVVNKVHFVSPVTGKGIGTAIQSIRAPQHWVQNMVQSVKFSDAIQALLFEDSEIAAVDNIIEIGPHGALQGAMRQILSSLKLPPSKVSLQYSLKRGSNAAAAMQKLAGTLHCQGLPVNMREVNFPSWDMCSRRPEVVPNLPTYAWDHSKRYWTHSVRVTESLERKRRRHYLLGTKLHGPTPNINIWRNTFRVDNMPWVQDHLLHSEFLFPGAGMLAMVLFAIAQIDEDGGTDRETYAVHNMKLYNGIIVPHSSTGIDIKLTIQNQDRSRLLDYAEQKVFDFYSHDGRGNWTGHCRGTVAQSEFPSMSAFAQRHSSFNGNVASVDISGFYQLLEETGPTLGPAFRHLSTLVCGDGFAEGIAIVPTMDATEQGGEVEQWLHPTLLDSFFEIAWVTIDRAYLNRLGTCIPRFARRTHVARGLDLVPGTKLRIVAFLDQCDDSGFEVSIFVMELDGDNTKRLILHTSGLRISSLSGGSQAPAVDNSLILQPTSKEMLIPSLPKDDASEAKVALPWPVIVQFSNSIGDPLVELVRETIHGQFDVEIELATLGQSSAVGKIAVFLDDVNNNFLSQCDSEGFDYLKSMLSDAETVLWVSRGSDAEPKAATHLGLLRTVRMEHGDKKYISLDLRVETPDVDYCGCTSAEAICDVLRHAVSVQSSSDFIYEFELRNRSLHRLDYQPVEELNNEYSISRGGHGELRASQYSWLSNDYLRLVAKDPGMLDSLSFIQDNTLLQSMPLADVMVEIAPHSFGLNFRDVLVAMGEMKEDWMGFECAGYVTQVGAAVSDNVKGIVVGSRVCCLMQGGHWANRIRVPLASVVPIPETMSFELAASIPMCFVTAYYGLVECGRLEADETVLIHAGAGGVGQAAIAIAQSLGAKVFATVGSGQKKEHLVQRYGLAEDRIFSSRNADFKEQILRATEGHGVDVLLNSLAGPLLQAGWDSMASCGRFIELGKRDARLDKLLAMRNFGDAASYIAIDIVRLGISKPKVLQRVFATVMDMLSTGRLLHKTPITSYSINDLAAAFRNLQSGKHLGKSVVTIQPHDQVSATPSHVPLPSLDKNGSYLIVGGTSGIGLEIARWLSRNGAGHLMLVSRNAADPKNKWICDEFDAAGAARVSLISSDVTSLDDMSHAVAEYGYQTQQNHGRAMPIRGVIQSAAVLDDGIFENIAGNH